MSSTDPAGPAAELPFWQYVVAFVIYVALGYTFKSIVLNWIVGPFFLVIVLYALPRAVRRVVAALPGRHR